MLEPGLLGHMRRIIGRLPAAAKLCATLVTRGSLNVTDCMRIEKKSLPTMKP
jgi:hypothetical protein